MPQDHPQLAGPGQLGELDEFPFAQAQNLAADDSCIPRPVYKPKDDDDVPHARPDHGGQKNSEDQCRQSQPGIGNPHNRLVDPMPKIAGEDAQCRANAASHQCSHQTDNERHPGAEDEAAQDIARLKICAERRLHAAPGHPERGGEELRALDG